MALAQDMGRLAKACNRQRQRDLVKPGTLVGDLAIMVDIHLRRAPAFCKALCANAVGLWKCTPPCPSWARARLAARSQNCHSNRAPSATKKMLRSVICA